MPFREKSRNHWLPIDKLSRGNYQKLKNFSILERRPNFVVADVQNTINVVIGGFS